MSTISSGRDADLLRLDHEFLDLVLADDDMVRAEFDAIVQATWSPPPVSPPARPTKFGRRGRRGPARLRGQPRHRTRAPRGLRFRRSMGARQRSPPPDGAHSQRLSLRRERDHQASQIRTTCVIKTSGPEIVRRRSASDASTPARTTNHEPWDARRNQSRPDRSMKVGHWPG